MERCRTPQLEGSYCYRSLSNSSVSSEDMSHSSPSHQVRKLLKESKRRTRSNPFLLCLSSSTDNLEGGGEANMASIKGGMKKSPSAETSRMDMKAKGGSRHKDLLSIQLEITERLLEAEERKLSTLKSEMVAVDDQGPVGAAKAKEFEMQQNAYSRIRAQFDRLSRELNEMATVAISKKKPIRPSRSLPAFGIKPAVKRRPSVYNIVHNGNGASEPVEGDDDMDNQLYVDASQVPRLSHAKGIEGLVFREGVLVSGTMDALIQLLQPTSKLQPDRTYLFAFILCSRLFTPPFDILSKIIRNCKVDQLPSSEDSGSLATNILQLLSDWTELFSYDFREERMMRVLRDVTKKLSALSTETKKSCGTLVQGLIQKLSVLDKYEQALLEINRLCLELSVDPHGPPSILSLCDDSLLMARQLTHIEVERINNIGPEEFIQTFTKDPEFFDVKKTTNIEAYVEWFNRFSSLVATEICTAEKKQRHRLLEFFLDVALECIKLHNYNSFMAIIAATSMTPVSRLKKTLSKIPSYKLHEVEHLMDPCSNFSVYREHLADSIQKRRSEYVIPFFSLFIKDIYFVNECHKNKRQDGTVNFEKFWALSRQVTQFISWKDTNIQFPRLPEVLRYLMTNPVMNEDELLLASYECEPPDNDFEKKRYRELVKDQKISTNKWMKRRGSNA